MQALRSKWLSSSWTTLVISFKISVKIREEVTWRCAWSKATEEVPTLFSTEFKRNEIVIRRWTKAILGGCERPPEIVD